MTMPVNEPETRQVGWSALKTHIQKNKIPVCLLCTRFLTVVFTIAYFVPIFGSPYSAYNKALIANAATSALRLHQRHPRMAPNRETLQAVLMEDSCHYLIYSLIFMYVSPSTSVLVPIFLFSLIHFASYSLTLLDTTGMKYWWGTRFLTYLVQLQWEVLRLISVIEILLMPYSMILLFMRRAGLFTPFFYSQFLVMRYNSQRNPYTRNTLRKMRITLEDFAARPTTPRFIRSIIKNGIQLISIFAFPLPAQNSR